MGIEKKRVRITWALFGHIFVFIGPVRKTMGTNIFFLTKKFFFLFLVLFASAVKKWYSYLCGDTRHEKGSS